MQFLHVLRIFCGKEAVCITHIVTEPQCGACGVPTKVGWPCCHQFLLQGISCLLLRQLARHSLSYLKINIIIMITIILTQYYDDHEQADTHTQCTIATFPYLLTLHCCLIFSLPAAGFVIIIVIKLLLSSYLRETQDIGFCTFVFEYRNENIKPK